MNVFPHWLRRFQKREVGEAVRSQRTSSVSQSSWPRWLGNTWPKGMRWAAHVHGFGWTTIGSCRVLTNDEIRVSARAGNQEIKDATTDNIASTVHNRTQLYTAVHNCAHRTKPPFWAVKRPARPYKKRHTNAFYCGKRCGRLAAPGGPDRL
jgi:hypothetical protein